MLLISTSLIQSQQWFQQQVQLPPHPAGDLRLLEIWLCNPTTIQIQLPPHPADDLRLLEIWLCNPTPTNSVATASRRRPSASQNVVVQPNTNKKFIPVVSGTYINYNSAGTTFNNPNVVVQSRPVVVPSAPVTAHINNGYNPFTRNTMNQHAYGNYGSKCAPRNRPRYLVMVS